MKEVTISYDGKNININVGEGFNSPMDVINLLSAAISTVCNDTDKRAKEHKAESDKPKSTIEVVSRNGKLQ